jgi:enhancing lycopene biosynthesis protein 2
MPQSWMRSLCRAVLAQRKISAPLPRRARSVSRSDLKALSLAMHAAGKPLGFICIAPAMLPKILISRCA